MRKLKLTMDWSLHRICPSIKMKVAIIRVLARDAFKEIDSEAFVLFVLFVFRPGSVTQ